MREVKRSALVSQPPARVFALINDIERYPEFLPWCTHARVLSRTPAEIVATHRRAPGSAARANSPPATRSCRTAACSMHLVSGPFRALEGDWRLTPIEAHGCRVEFAVRFEFRSRLIGTAVRAAVRADHRLAGGRVRAARACAGVRLPPRKRCLVAYATPARQYLWPIELPPEATIAGGAGGVPRCRRARAPTAC